MHSGCLVSAPERVPIRSTSQRRCPQGADRGAIGDIYRNCQSGYVVDHIIPLRGKYVGGLNVPQVEALGGREHHEEEQPLVWILASVPGASARL